MPNLPFLGGIQVLVQTTKTRFESWSNFVIVCRHCNVIKKNTLHHGISSICLTYYLLQLKAMCSDGSLKLLTFILPGAFAKEGFKKVK